MQSRQPVGCRLTRRFVSRGHGCNHCADVVKERADELGKPGRCDPAWTHRPRSGCHRANCRRIEAGAGALRRKVLGRFGRMGGLLRDSLQGGEAGLRPTIRREPFGNTRRQQHFSFAKLLDNGCLHCGPVNLD